MSFYLKALKLCLGDGVSLLEIREMRKVCLVRASTNKHRKRRKLKSESNNSKQSSSVLSSYLHGFHDSYCVYFLLA